MEKETWRSTPELISELEAEASRFQEIALVIGFENVSPELIFNSDGSAQQKLEKLNAFHRRGGTPFGFIGYARVENTFTVYTRRLEEFVSEEWAADALHKLADLTKENLLKLPGFEVVCEKVN